LKRIRPKAPGGDAGAFVILKVADACQNLHHFLIVTSCEPSACRSRVAGQPISQKQRSILYNYSMNPSQYHVTPDASGKRIDVLAAEIAGITRSRIQHIIDKGLLLVNGKTVRHNYRARPGDEISLSLPIDELGLVAEDIPIEILYSDDKIIVVNKPPGMVVYPGAGHSSGTLMNAVAHFSPALATVGGPLRPGVVHRLDKDTSGVMVIAAADDAYYSLVEQFRERTINRTYVAIVFGNLSRDRGEISLKIGRSESDRKKMSTRVRRGKEAVTRWKVLERYQAATLIEAKLGTGRTHQIRVHFASMGHPVLGDRTYGKKTIIEAGRRKIAFERQMLHAMTLGFLHPAKGQYMEFVNEMPEDMRAKVQQLRSVAAPS
jgi:23S rRNA pseudouridine1911/1915/1917 synthase